jgi:2-oxoglutarate ferredoxin oxidoreductase subunit gamma
MDGARPAKAELIVAGLGGMGVLVAGRLLAAAALSSYRHVSWMPTYGEARRGGLSDCTVILSAEEIASPILDQSACIMLFDSAQIKAFEPRVRPGGLMIVERASLRERPAREDIRMVPVPGMETAMGLGHLQAANLVMLGAYAELAGSVPAPSIEDELRRTYSGATLERNMKAFKAGLEAGGSLASG